MISYWTRIDPLHNCFRYYTIAIESDLFDKYLVKREWGRLGTHHRRPSSLTERFDSHEDAMTYVKAQEAERVKKRYRQQDSLEKLH